MVSPLFDKVSIFAVDPSPMFWDKHLYYKSDIREIKDNGFKYYDDVNILKYIFYSWFNKWAIALSRKYVEPYKLQPLQVSDQILKWEPKFSKHISDGLIRMDLYEATKYSNEPIKPYVSTLLRAIFLTFWVRILSVFVGIILSVGASLNISGLIKKMLEILNRPKIHVAYTIMMLLAILVLQIVVVLLLENINFYVYRMIYTLHYLYGIVAYRHALSHRRVYYNSINNTNILGTCDQILHSCDPGSQCSDNPFFCPAQRYHNKEMGPKIFTYVFYDSFYIAMAFESTKIIVQFLANFIYGVFLMSRHVKANIWVLYLAGSLFLFFMVVFEIFNAVIFKYILYIRDYKVNKYNEILGSLSNIKKTLIDDIGFNIITRTRNDELVLIFIKVLITFINMCLYSTSINVSFYLIKRYFVKTVNEANAVTDINTAAFMATFYIYLRIVTSMFLIPRAINIVGMAYASYKRLNLFLTDSSPTFYITSNIYTGSAKVAINVVDKTNQVPSDVLVYFKNATFAWVNTRCDLFRKKYDTQLENINFEVKRGQTIFITGSKGAGKSNLIKAMLGDMTLVGGSMAVIPLYTAMPIFYASQDIFLQQGTIRSNITFGYKFDEEIYNTVLKAVELEFDISTWEKGDLRVVSDNEHSLNGGQRVRIEMARAVYAYLIFHKVNKEYNNSKCSFLMCLDASFHGLDPYVSKSIFNSLFNPKNGTLIKDDLAVVLTSSKLILHTCTKFSDATQLPNSPIYNIHNKKLTYVCTLHEFITNKWDEYVEHKYLTTARNVPCPLNSLTKDMIAMCIEGANDKTARAEITTDLYKDSFVKYVKDHFGNAKFNPYFAFMKPAAISFSLYIIMTVGLNILDYVKFVMSTKLSDYISRCISDSQAGTEVDLETIKARSNASLRLTSIFVLTIIILSILATIALTVGSIVSCRKLHEYCLNTIFNYSSSIVKIKKQINQVITFLSCDLMMTDDITGLFIALLLFSLIQTLINITTLFFLIPISIPFIVATLILIYIYIIKRYIGSAISLNYGFLESLGQMNRVIVRSISGGSVYRSFNRNSDLLGDFLEHRDYNARTKFLFAAAVSWATILFTWSFSLTTFIILVIAIMQDRYTKYKITVGYFGLALSLCTNVIKSFSNFSFLYASTEQLMGSLGRFRYFIPVGKKLKFDKCPNTHEEHLINPTNKDVTDLDKKQLLKRRAIEFRADNIKFYGLRRLFYHPKIHILDVDKYITPEHTGVELKDVCVYTTPDLNPEGMILKHLTVSAHKSEIIGMVGRTGAGKTTLLSVFHNTVSNRTGQVLLDGKDMNDIPKNVLRQIIGVLPQLPFVFKGWTVRRFIDPRKLFTDDQIHQALNTCGLSEFLKELPGGKMLDTVLVLENLGLSRHIPKSVYQPKVNGSDSIRTSSELNSLDGYGKYTESTKNCHQSDTLLSNTQLRTLSLARLVLYRHFYRMIVVDEPPEEDLLGETTTTHPLGVPIYDLIEKYFSHCTTFVTAHDVSVLKSCTSVWVIHEGGLVKTCKASDVSASESIAAIIEQNVKKNEPQHVNTVM